LKTVNDLRECRNILVINLGGIGDILLSTAALKPLRERYPQARLDALVVGRAAPFLESYGICSRVYVFPGTRDAAALVRLLRQLRRTRYDLVVNFRTLVSARSALLMRLLLKAIGGKVIAGRDTDGRGSFFDISVPEVMPGTLPEYSYDVALVRQLGATAPPAGITVPINDSDRAAATRLLEEHGIKQGKLLVGVNPGGSLSRRWPSENFVQLCQMLAVTTDCTIALTGSFAEKELCRNIVAAIGLSRVYDLSGTTTVNQLAALIRRFSLFITNDTGPMHICTAVGTPGVYIFGPGIVSRYAPFRNPERYAIVRKPSPCSPCEKPVCASMECLSALSVDDVYEAAITLNRRINDR
jgi:ADP-heptose:LPS heptosyltransferase